jgi:Flp pilus assembly protein TadG
MLEFVLAFPLILLLILGCMQLSHIWLARQVVLYAAYCAARSMLVCTDGEYQAAAQQAAEQVCAWVIIGQAPGEPEKEVPGWGKIPGSGAVARKTRVSVGKIGEWNVAATVEFDFAMVFPFVGNVIGWMVNPWQQGNEWREQRADFTGDMHRYIDAPGYPHVRFRETVILSKPYVTLPEMGIPSGGW